MFKHGLLAQKEVVLTDVDLQKIDIPGLSEDVKRVIRESKIQGLQRFVGPDGDRITRDAVKEYWKTR